jgi:DNA-binding transcriptional LysR family regulator
MLRNAGHAQGPTVESDSTIVLLSHVRTGGWSTILPPVLADSIGLTDELASVPIVAPAVTHSVGLVVPYREPSTPLVNALVTEAKRLAAEFDER